MTTTREEETPFTIGVASFTLRPMSDGLCAEIERRLRGLPLHGHLALMYDDDGVLYERMAWTLEGEAKPTYKRFGFSVIDL
jgi:hypothetical protein